jgi:hypothetical protein
MLSWLKRGFETKRKKTIIAKIGLCMVNLKKKIDYSLPMTVMIKNDIALDRYLIWSLPIHVAAPFLHFIQ